MMNTPGWDKWFLDELWSRLPAALYYPKMKFKVGDPVGDDPERLEQLRAAAEVVGAARVEAKDLIYYLGGLRDPKVIRLLGPILLLEGETVFGGDVMDSPPRTLAEKALFDMDIYGFPDFQTTEAKRQWWLKNKDLADAQWWELLRKGAEQRAKERKPFTPEGVPNPPPRPAPVPVTPPPVLVPKPITPEPAPRIPRSSISTPRRQAQVPQLASEADAFWPRWLAVGTVTTGLGWLLLRRGDDSSES